MFRSEIGHAGASDGVLLVDGESFVRALQIPANDIVYNHRDRLLYATIPSTAAEGGNTVTALDPVSGRVVKRIHVGSEPKRLALSRDGATLYVDISGAASVRRVDLVSGTAQESYGVGVTASERMTVSDIAVHPGDSGVLAVAKTDYSYNNVREISVFRDGVQASLSVSGRRFVEFSADGTLYGSGNNNISKIGVVSKGLVSQAAFNWSSDHKARVFGEKLVLSSGRVLDRNTGDLLGVLPFDGWPATPAFVPDVANNRVYSVARLLTSENQLSIQAYDGTDLSVTGSLRLPINYSDPLKVVRWGSNGIAFTTSTGTLFLVQTTLVPNGEPIPTPTSTTPTPTPASTPPVRSSFKIVPVSPRNILTLRSDGMIYATLPSTEGAYGNRLAVIDPMNGEISATHFAGSEPNLIDKSADESFLYVGLDGSLEVNKFDVRDRQFVGKFKTGSDPARGPFRIAGLSVSPVDPNAVAVSRRLETYGIAGVSIFDSGTARPSATGASSGVVFSPTGDAIYGIESYSGLERITYDSGGTRAATKIPFPTGSRIRFSDGLVYSTVGKVLDPTSNRLVGSFALPDSGFERAAVLDSGNQRAFFASFEYNRLVISAYDSLTFVPLGSIVCPQINLRPRAIERWGNDGLAVVLEGGPMILIRSSLVDPRTEIVGETPPSVVAPTPAPAHPAIVTRIDVPANQIVHNPFNGLVYASVPSTSGGSIANSVTAFDPRTGRVDQSIAVGNKPRRLAFTDDFEKLWVNFDGTSTIRRFDVRTRSQEIEFSPQLQSGGTVVDVEAVPGSHSRVAVSGTNNPPYLFDNGIRLTGIGTGYRSGAMDFSDATGKLISYNGESSGFEMFRMRTGQSGLSAEAISSGLLFGYGCDFVISSGLLYATSGRVIDPETFSIVGTFAGSGRSVAVDRERKRAFFLENGSISAFDLETFLPLGKINFESPESNASDLIIVGPGMLAYRATSGSQSYVKVVRSRLIAPEIPVPSGFRFRNTFVSVNETAAYATIIVERIGETTDAVAVDFTTRNVSATAGDDYEAASGTLYFQPGQSEAEIKVGILDDGIDELGDEFDVQLLNAREGVLLERNVSRVGIDDPEDFAIVGASPILITESRNGSVATGDLRVRLSNPTNYFLRVNYRTVNGSAVGGSDYAIAIGTLMFEPGETEKPLTLSVYADSVPERYEFFVVELMRDYSNGERTPAATIGIRDRALDLDRPIPFDFDADGRTDASVRRNSDSSWWIRSSSTDQVATAIFGVPGDTVLSGDFSGDKISDIAVFRDSTGEWLYLRSEDGTMGSFAFGLPGDLPASGDFNGDGKMEAAVFRPASATWYIRFAEDDVETVVFGSSGDLPTVDDWDGDGRSDIAVWRRSTGEWWHLRSSDGEFRSFVFGSPTDQAVFGDFTGDRIADAAVYRPSDSGWSIRRSEDGSYFSFVFGLRDDIPVPGDYDGDGRLDAAVFRPSEGMWYLSYSSNGESASIAFGSNGDQPLPQILVR